MGQLIDTSVLINMERRGRHPDFLSATADEEPLTIAAITFSELLTGVHLAESAERRFRREQFVTFVLEAFTVESFDLPVARTYAEIWAQLRTSGQLVGAHDLLIAATAVAHGHSVLTHNLRDFRRVPGLVVNQPKW